MTVRKPETVFSGAINRLLPYQLHYEKMNNPYRSGTADFWYSGSKADLWIEYKWLPKHKESVNLTEGTKPALSVQQQNWLRRRYSEGRNVAVVVGTPNGAKILRDLDWERTWSATAFITRSELAAWIIKETYQ